MSFNNGNTSTTRLKGLFGKFKLKSSPRAKLKDIRGTGNHIFCENTSLKKTRFEIWGNNNQSHLSYRRRQS
jgi:hypothetical protein